MKGAVIQYLGGFDMATAAQDYENLTIPNDYAMEGLIIEARFRNVVAVASTAAPNFGSPFTFLERIAVEGQLQGKGSRTVFSLSGRQCAQYGRLVGAIGTPVDPDNFIVGAGAAATYDIQAYYYVPFNALGASPMARMLTLLPGNRFVQPLTLRIRRGGLESLAEDAGGSTQTFTAYGVGTGSPRIEVHRVLVKEGMGKAARTRFLCTHTSQGPFTTTANLTNGRIGELSTGRLIGRIFLQSGVVGTGGAQPELVTGQAAVLTRVYLMQAENFIRNFQFRTGHQISPWFKGVDTGTWLQLTSQGIAGQTGGFAIGERVGECLIDFIPDGNLDDALMTEGWLQRGDHLFLNGDVTGLANSQIEVVTEEYEHIG